MRILTITLLLLASLFAAPVMATNPLCSDIGGQVVDADRQPIVGARVVITHLETGRVVVKHTNSRGRYLALNLRPDGHYRLRVETPQGWVEFHPGEVHLGHRMRRNAVIAPEGTTNTWPWQWRMRDVIASQKFGLSVSRAATAPLNLSNPPTNEWSAP